MMAEEMDTWRMAEFSSMHGKDCYAALAKAQLEISEENILKWLAENTYAYDAIDRDDFDDFLEAFVKEAKEAEAKAKTVAAAAEGAK